MAKRRVKPIKPRQRSGSASPPPPLGGPPAPPTGPMGFHGDRVDWITNNQGNSFLPGLEAIHEDVAINYQLTRGGRVNPLYIPLSQIPWREREVQKEALSSIMGFEQYYHEFGAPEVVRPSDALNRGFGTYSLPRSAFMSGNATEAHFAMIAQTWQHDARAVGVDQWMPSGRQLTPQALTNITSQLNDNLTVGSRLVFDVESAGLEAEKGIWQLSARHIDDQGRELSAINLHFDNKFMDAASIWGDPKKPMNFRQYYDDLVSKRKFGNNKAVSWISTETDAAIAEGIRPFFEMAKQSESLMGQNVTFDVEMIRHLATTNSHYLNNVDGFKDLVDEFLERSKTSDLVDTRHVSMALMGEMDALGAQRGTRIAVADALVGKKQYTPFSMENILLRSSFLSDLEEHLGSGYTDEYGKTAREAIHNRIQEGLHFGDIDTWFENHLFTMLQRVRRGETGANGRVLLQVAGEGMSDKDAWQQFNIPMSVGSEIGRKGSMTPFTKGSDGLTPIERKIIQDRRRGLIRRGRTAGHITTDPLSNTPGAIRGKIFHTGIFDRWMNTFMNNDGRMAKRQTFAAGFEAIQDAAIDANLPFSHISAFERALTTMFSQTTLKLGSAAKSSVVAGQGIDRLHTVRKAMGDVLGSGLFMAAPKAMTFGGEASPKNVALPMELLRRAEESGVNMKSVFNKVLGADEMTDIQEFRVSPIHWPDAKGVEHKDIGLVVDPFENQGQIDDFIDFLRTQATTDDHFGLAEGDTLERVIKGLTDNSLQYGVQVGTMGGGAGNAGVAAVHDVLAELNLGVDESYGLHVRTSLLGNKDLLDAAGDPNVIMTGPMEVKQIGKTSVWLNEADQLSELNSQAKAVHYALTEAAESKTLMMALGGARKTGRINQARRIYEFAETGIRNLPKAAGIAGLAAAAYYITRRVHKQNEYDETFERQDYEDPGFYNRYKQEMGEPIRNITPSRNINALQTAGMVQNLHNEKNKHHMMGNDKYNHLYQGA